MSGYDSNLPDQSSFDLCSDLDPREQLDGSCSQAAGFAENSASRMIGAIQLD